MTTRLNICLPSGYGHYKIGIIYRGKEYSTITSDMSSIDDYKSDPYEKDGRELRHKRGYLSLRNEIIREHDLR